MAVSRKEGIQHEIELSAAWGPTVVSTTGLPTSLSAHQMPTDMSAFHGPTVPVGPPVADRSLSTYRPLSGRQSAICHKSSGGNCHKDDSNWSVVHPNFTYASPYHNQGFRNV